MEGPSCTQLQATSMLCISWQSTKTQLPLTDSPMRTLCKLGDNHSFLHTWGCTATLMAGSAPSAQVSRQRQCDHVRADGQLRMHRWQPPIHGGYGRTFLFTFFFRKVNSSRKRCAEGTTQ